MTKDIRELNTGDLFTFEGETTVREYRGNGWYSKPGPYGGGLAHTYSPAPVTPAKDDHPLEDELGSTVRFLEKQIREGNTHG